jgi:hypothetical protein
MRSRDTVAAVLVAGLLGCQPSGPDRPHTPLGPDLSLMQAAFNADSGKVRVIMLASPT